MHRNFLINKKIALNIRLKFKKQSPNQIYPKRALSQSIEFVYFTTDPISKIF